MISQEELHTGVTYSFQALGPARQPEIREKLIFSGMPIALVQLLQQRNSTAFTMRMALYTMMSFTQSLSALKRFAKARVCMHLPAWV